MEADNPSLDNKLADDSSSELPNIEEILASEVLLSPPDVSARVVRVRQYAIKYGTGISLLEARNIRYISESCGLSFVPRVYSTITEEATGRKFIIMEYIEGTTLDKLWQSLESADKMEICRQLRQALTQLRAIESPEYIGSLDHGHCADVIFWTPPPIEQKVSGPFEQESEMNEGMMLRIAGTESATYAGFVRKLVSATLHGHGTCFTHGDLQAKNVMVRVVAGRPDGECGDAEDDTKRRFEIKIIDWEYAGWYPDYWEFCAATFIARFRPEWLEVVNEVLEVSPQEHLMMQLIRGIVLG